MLKLRKPRWAIIVAILSYTAILFGNWLLVYQPSQAIQSAWLTHSKQLKQQSLVIGNLTKEFGYSGFIHHFKNYVLRRDDAYLNSANRSMTNTLLLIDDLKTLYTDPGQLADLTELEQVALQYQKKMLWIQANPELSQQLSPTELDQEVYVDDSAATLALRSLFSNNQANIQQATEESKDLYRILAFKSLLWLFTLSLLYWASVGYLLQRKKNIHIYSEHLSAINDLSPSAMVLFDAQGRVLSANLKFKKMFAIEPKVKLSNLVIEDFIPEQYRTGHKNHREKFMQSNRTSAMDSRPGEFFGKRLNGEEFPAEIAIAPIGDLPDRKVMAIIHDKSREVLLAEQANTDYLTKVSNRKFAEEQLANELYRFNRYHDPLSIFLIDIDHFKQINDSHGHSAGDQILISVVNIIEKNLRQTDILARWGGDEFLVVLPNTPLVQAKELAEKLLLLTRNSFKTTDIPVTLSIGLADAKAGQSAKSLLKTADAALYIAKDNGRNRVSTVQLKQSTNDH